MIVVPFRAEHLFLMEAQDAQQDEVANVPLEYAKQMESIASFTAMQDGEVLGCAGVFPFHDNRALCWTYISKNAGKHFVQIHRRVKAFLDAVEYNRLEMDVAFEFQEGHRWAKLLGFEVETPCMKKYFVHGGDATRYVRIR
jgi:hypothetical protein